MPSHGNLERLVGAAIVDGEFRASLLDSPLSAASAFGLSAEELAMLESAKASTLEDLAAHIHAWVTNAPKPRRMTFPRSALEGYQAARIAV